MIHSIIQFSQGKAKSLHCSTDASKAEAAFLKSETGIVTWYRMAPSGGDVFSRVDHEANAAQAAKAAADAKNAERDAALRAEQEHAYLVKQTASDAATQAVLDGADQEGIAKAVSEALADLEKPAENKSLSPQDNEPGEGVSPSDDPGSPSAEGSDTDGDSNDDPDGEEE
ncbi:MAG: hypothetical protein ACPG32_04370 [Akkermansiaceae bacterium]